MQQVVHEVPHGKWGQLAKSGQVLPPEVYEAFEKDFGLKTDKSTGRMRSAYIWKLKDLGWTASAISRAMGVTRERVRQLGQTRPEDNWLDYVLTHFPLPPAPVYAEFHGRKKYVRDTPQPSDRVRKRLLELQPYAEMIRGHGPRYRAEAEEYVRLLDYAVKVEKVQIATLAKLLGVTHAAVANRMIRYGFKKTTGKSRALQTVLRKNRAKGRSR
jgi:hypothetical protein